MFLDETGFLTAPLVRRTWAPRGQSPVLRENRRTWEKAPAVGVLAVSPRRRRVRLLFSLRANENIHAEWLITFLRDVKHHLGPRVVLVWDNLALHRSAALRTFFRQQCFMRAWYLPPYAPELIPSSWCGAKPNSDRSPIGRPKTSQPCTMGPCPPWSRSLPTSCYCGPCCAGSLFLCASTRTLLMLASLLGPVRQKL